MSAGMIPISAGHVLVITGSNEDGCDERRYRIDHYGPVDTCAMWVPCDRDLPCADDVQWAPDGKVFHGVEHSWGDDAWVVRPNEPTCIYTRQFVADDLPDVAADLEYDGGPLTAGRYLVGLVWMGDGEFDLNIRSRLDDTEPARPGVG
jgi:hypothetical protein